MYLCFTNKPRQGCGQGFWAFFFLSFYLASERKGEGFDDFRERERKPGSDNSSASNCSTHPVWLIFRTDEKVARQKRKNFKKAKQPPLANLSLTWSKSMASCEITGCGEGKHPERQGRERKEKKRGEALFFSLSSALFQAFSSLSHEDVQAYV